jgi:transcriptional regulator GlxA family with amidase domain
LYLIAVSEEDEDRLDIAEASKVLETMRASGEEPIPIDELAKRLGL